MKINSDAALVLNMPTGRFYVAVEYEISEKEVSRYTKKLTEYYFSPQIAAVFYICRDRRIESVVRQTDLEVGKRFEAKVYTCLEEAVQKQSPPVALKDRENATFLLK